LNDFIAIDDYSPFLKFPNLIRLFPWTSLSEINKRIFFIKDKKMSGPPPPPPPGLSGLAPPKKFTPAPPSSGGGDMRNALLGQIQKGAKLKKVQTVDKSAPLVAGKIAGEPASSPSRGPSQFNKSSPDSASASPARKPPGGFANLAEELQFKMTLKKNKNSPVKESNNVAEPKEVRTNGIQFVCF
jgi:hypothetical protein